MNLIQCRLMKRSDYYRGRDIHTSGSLSDGMVIVDAEDTDKIQLVLDDVSISNSQSAALYIRSADKVFCHYCSGNGK